MRQFVRIIYLFWEIHGKTMEFLMIPWKIVVISWYFEGNSGEIQGKSRKNLSKWVTLQSKSNIYRCYTCYTVTSVTGVTAARRN